MVSLLILTEPIQRIIPSLPKVLKAASHHVKDRLFIHLDRLSLSNTPKEYSSLLYRSRIISSIYSTSPSLCPGVDVCVLMSGFKQMDTPIDAKVNFEKICIDYICKPSDFSILKERYIKFTKSEDFFILLNSQSDVAGTEQPSNIHGDSEDKIYKDVVAGGTFDRMHAGHKILLSEAVLRCLNRLTVGVGNGPLLKKKVLKELILPCSQRTELLRDFLMIIDPSLKYNLVEITEPMGPTSYDPNMEMIVVSDETKKGVALINEYRRDHGLKELESYCIRLFQDTLKHYKEEEEKFSSSTERMRLLGTRLKGVSINSNIPPTPYIIGLTGGSASGKTNIGKRLEELGAAVIDCDKLGHEAYEYNSDCYHKIVNKFGQSILNEGKDIDRKLLGSIVFGDKAKLKQLTDIVWPQIAALAKAQIETRKKQGKKVIILDAAVLLEANWDLFCHEVWVSIIDREEAIRRIVERDGLSLEAAQNRIDSQLSNEERVARAHIVFSTLWSYDCTRHQVKKAWNILESEGKLYKGNL